MAPNKIIFQLGILSFCVTAIILGSQEMSLMDTVLRSFIVFVGVILTTALALMGTSMLMSKRSPQTEVPGGKGKQESQPATPKKQEKTA